MGSHSNKFNSLRYSFVRVLFKQLIIKMMKIAVLAFALFAAVIAEPEAEASPDAYYGMLDMVMVTVMVMVMVFMADTDMVDTDMVDTAVDTDTDTTLARDPLMLMPKPAQLCSMVPMDTHSITESTHTLMPHSD